MRIALLLFLGIMLLAGCGEGGTQVSYGSQCEYSGRTGVCTLDIEYIEGTLWVYEVRSSSFVPYYPLDVTINASVERGSVRIWFDDQQGEQQTMTIRPSEPGQRQSVLQLTDFQDEVYFQLYFEPLLEDNEQRVENLQVVINYSQP